MQKVLVHTFLGYLSSEANLWQKLYLLNLWFRGLSALSYSTQMAFSVGKSEDR